MYIGIDPKMLYFDKHYGSAIKLLSAGRDCFFVNIGAFHTGSAQGSAQKILSWAWAEPELSLQREQVSAQIFSAGLEFLIRAAGCNPSRAPSRASVKYPIIIYITHVKCRIWAHIWSESKWNYIT